MIGEVIDCFEAEWRLFPLHPIRPDGSCGCGGCRAPGKHPIHSNWPETQPCDEDRQEQLLAAGHEGYGIALDGLLVVDVDERSGGLESMESLKSEGIDLLAIGGFIVHTGGGGFHVYFTRPENERFLKDLKGKGYHGIDLKQGHGQYTVAPGSAHVSGNRYHVWDGSPDAIGQPPEALLAICRKPEPEPSKYVGSSQSLGKGNVVDQLRHISPNCSYDEWIKIGMGVHDALGRDGYPVWDAWSAQGDDYPGAEETWMHYRSFRPNGGVTAGTLYHHAKRGGWKGPRRDAVERTHSGLPVELAQDQPRQIISNFLRGGLNSIFGNAILQVVDVTLGLGKTRSMIDAINAAPSERVLIFARTHANAEEIAENIPDSVHFHGRNEDNCQVIAQTGNFEGIGLVCRSCEYAPTCEWRQQFQSEARVRIMPHAYLNNGPPEEVFEGVPEPDYAFIDEDPTGEFRQRFAVSGAELTEARAMGPSMAEFVASIRSEDTDLLAALASGAEDELRTARQRAFNDLKDAMRGGQRASLPGITARIGMIDRLSEILAIALDNSHYHAGRMDDGGIECECWRLPESLPFVRPHVSTHLDDDGREHQRKTARRIPTMLLDATWQHTEAIWAALMQDGHANDLEEQPVFFSRKVNTVHVTENLHIVQQFSNGRQARELEQWIPRLIHRCNALAAIHGPGVLFTKKDIADRIRQQEGVNFMVGHYGQERGLNTWEHCQWMYCFGAARPSDDQVYRAAELLWPGDIERGATLGLEDATLADNSHQGVTTRRYTDPRCEAVMGSIVDASIQQTVGRLRGVRASHPKLVILDINRPIPGVAPNAIEDSGTLLGDPRESRFDQLLARFGCVVMSAPWLIANAPDLFTSEKAANEWAKRVKKAHFSFIYSKGLASLFNCKGPRAKRWATAYAASRAQLESVLPDDWQIQT